jgi:hypothetical protein
MLGGYIVINTGVISDNALSSIVPESGRVNVFEINFQILNYSYKILNLSFLNVLLRGSVL